MDAMVSARVPVEIKKQGDSVLKEIGSSVTELVNAAYDYVIKQRRIPGQTDAASAKAPQGVQLKTLSGEEARRFEETWARRALLEAEGYDGSNFRTLLDEAREDRYARFA